MNQVGQLRFDPPNGFLSEEVMATFRVPSSDGFEDPRSSTPIRPNLVVHSRPDESRGDVSRLLATVHGELAVMPGISRIETGDLTFADGTVGVLLAYVMPAPNDLEIAQLQALRIDGDTATSLTISTERAQLSEELKATYLEALASARIDPDGQ
ncbi:MAG: hypothetical protein ACYS22_19600 [Planctomycetota bacterium]|jgi:hypothetical protein